jgi:hypothetical protein
MVWLGQGEEGLVRPSPTHLCSYFHLGRSNTVLKLSCEFVVFERHSMQKSSKIYHQDKSLTTPKLVSTQIWSPTHTGYI